MAAAYKDMKLSFIMYVCYSGNYLTLAHFINYRNISITQLHTFTGILAD